MLCLGKVGVQKWSLRVDIGCTEEEIVGAARRRVGLDEGRIARVAQALAAVLGQRS